MATEDTLSQLGCLLRVVLVGGENVGCNTLMAKFTHQTLTSPPFSHKESEVVIDGIRVRLVLFHWRILRSTSTMTMNLETWGRMLQAAVFVFSLTDHSSLAKMETYLLKLNHLSSRAKVIIGNKTDLLTDIASPTLIEGKELAAKYSLPFYQTSALTGENVEHMFITLAAEALVNVHKHTLPSLFLSPKLPVTSAAKTESDPGPDEAVGDTVLLTDESERDPRSQCCQYY